MTNAVEHAIRESNLTGATHYARHVRRLALAYIGMFVFSLASIGLLIRGAQFYVTLSQRSNVETLVLAFLVVSFAYLVLLSAPGV